MTNTTPKPGKKPTNDSSVSPKLSDAAETETPAETEAFTPGEAQTEDSPKPRQHVDGAPHKTPPVSEYFVISDAAVDPVLLSAVVYKNTRKRKSLSVKHVQRRLVEWGYTEAGADVDGYYGDLTKAAVERFQTDQGLEGAGIANRETLDRLFENDNNVKVAE